MWAEMFPGETASALADRAANPIAPPAPRRSAWAELGDVLASPFTGAAQGVNESLRVLNRLGNSRATQADSAPRAGLLPGMEPPAALARARDASRGNGEAAFQASDDALRRGAEHWRPDPMTAGHVTNFLHDAGRVVSKFGAYSLFGGAPAAVAGTSVDEGVTSFMNLRDQGVDAGTATRVGAVHGALTAVSAGLPAAAATPLRSALLVGLSGPGAYMAESALSREILQAADYPHLAATFDPFDPMGLALSLVPGAAVAAGVHVARSRTAARANAPERPPVEALPPEAVEAAHVQLQRDLIEAGNLGRVDDPAAGVAHLRALDEAHNALEAGRRAELPARLADEARAAPVLAHMTEQMQAAYVPRLIDEFRAEESRLGMEPTPAASAEPLAALSPAGSTPDVQPVRAPLQRALEVVRDRPDLPVRLEDDGPAQSASDVVRTEAQRASQEATEAITATQAAINCFLKLGGS